MRRIPNISITPQEYRMLQKSSKARGGEGIICTNENPNSLYKLFLSPKDDLCPMPENKQKKIIELYRRRISHITEPLSTISCDGELVGYEMTWNRDDRCLEKLPELSRKELIRILKQSMEILKYFDKQDITYGDVQADNILVNIRTGKITFCDIDNIRIGQYPIDAKGYSLTRYYERTGVIDGKADAYMHNLLTMKTLAPNNPFESEILRDIRLGIYPTGYKQRALPIFESMSSIENFTGEYIVQYIKR